MKLTPLLLDITRSRWGFVYSCLLHSLAIVAVGYFPVSLFYQLLAGVLICAHCLWSLRDWFFPSGAGLLHAVGFADGQWQLYRRDDVVSVYLVQSTIWSWLVVLNFRESRTRKSHALVLWPDSADRQQLRRLRVVLRHLPVYGCDLIAHSSRLL